MGRRHKGNSSNLPELDLHGYTVREAEEALLQFLSDSIMSGSQRVHIIHGHGTGKIKGLVHRILGESDVIKNFEVQMTNSGTTTVHL